MTHSRLEEAMFSRICCQQNLSADNKDYSHFDCRVIDNVDSFPRMKLDSCDIIICYSRAAIDI